MPTDLHALAPAPVLAGAQVLDDIRDLLARFVAFPDEHSLNAAALWAAHTHALEAFDTSPRIAFLSPEPGSGKTRALEILELLVVRPLLTVNVTPAYLFRKVSDEAGPPTILYDEIDTVFGPKAKDNEDIRGMLNSGYRKGATAGRCTFKGKNVETEELPSYAAVALAGLDDLPDTIMTRSIVVRMRRRAPHEVIESYRRRTHQAQGHEIRDRLAAWIDQAWPQIDDAWPELPEGIEDRDADVWEPLIALADAAGGHWPALARCSAVALVAAARDATGSLGVRLLADLRAVFTATGEDRMTTDSILETLCNLEESPWGDLRGKALDSRNLARRLSKYAVKPKQIRLGERNVRGYERGDLLDAWTRYLPDEAAPDLWSEGYPPQVSNRGDDPVSAPVGQPRAAATPATPLQAFTPPTGPGRCSTCGFHTETQGHRNGCAAA